MKYQVLRDDRPIGARYYVRAVDTADNYSASTEAIQAA